MYISKHGRVESGSLHVVSEVTDNWFNLAIKGTRTANVAYVELVSAFDMQWRIPWWHIFCFQFWCVVLVKNKVTGFE